MSKTNNPPSTGRKRARQPNGKFKGDNPSTPDINEAWEPIEVSPALPKEKYAKKGKITGMSKNTAGKYANGPKVTRPGMGKTTTTYN